MIKKIELQVKSTNTKFEQVKISEHQDAYNIIRRFYFDDLEIYESAFILLLNEANKMIAYAKISQGGTVGTVVDVKLIAKYAIDCLASGVVLAHNHPSGNLNPSQQDIAITDKVKKALKLLDIYLVDHLIITKEGYYSFAEQGLID